MVMDEGVGGWFVSWKWFDELVNEENFLGKVLYKWEEGVVLGRLIK